MRRLMKLGKEIKQKKVVGAYSIEDKDDVGPRQTVVVKADKPAVSTSMFRAVRVTVHLGKGQLGADCPHDIDLCQKCSAELRVCQLCYGNYGVCLECRPRSFVLECGTRKYTLHVDKVYSKPAYTEISQLMHKIEDVHDVAVVYVDSKYQEDVLQVGDRYTIRELKNTMSSR